MSEIEKRDILEDLKKLSPEKRAYVAGIASGLSMAESKARKDLNEEGEGHAEPSKRALHQPG